MSFRDKVVWVTGASSGIGEAVAYAFIKDGAKVIISARRESELERVKNASAHPENVRILTLDIAEHDQMPSKAKEAMDFFGKIDVMFHNAGISQRSLVVDTSLDIDRKLMEVNYLGTVALTKALLPLVLPKGGCHFAVVSSLVGKFGSPLRSGYAASKHALHGFFDSMRAELYNKGVKVTMICPGYITTNVSINALTGDGSNQGTMDEKTAAGMPPDVAAQKMLAAIEKGKLEVNVGGKETYGVLLKRFLPITFASFLQKAQVT